MCYIMITPSVHTCMYMLVRERKEKKVNGSLVCINEKKFHGRSICLPIDLFCIKCARVLL